MSKKAKIDFYTKANYHLSHGTPHNVIYALEDIYDVTKEEIKEYIEQRATSKAIKGALTSASREEQEAKYNVIDQKFIERYKHIVTLRRGENVNFYNYESGVYKEVLDRDMEDLLDSFMAQLGLLVYRNSNRKIKDTILRIGALLARTEGRHFKDDDVIKQKWRLNLSNGLLDLETLNLSEHTDEYFSTVQVPYPYDPEALCPKFDDFIYKVSNNDDSTAEMIQEMFGYCIDEGNPNHKVFYLYGDTARNGKSTAAKIISGLIGWGNVSTLSLSQLAGENSSILTSLVGKQINFSDEISSKFIESSRLTTMSAEGIVEINPKFKKAYLYTVTAKFIITCNDLPQFHDAQGMKYRMISIPFTYHFPEKDRILRYEQILLEEEGSGILNFAIEGLQGLKKNKVFSINEQSAEDMHQNILQGNSPYHFLEDKFEFDLAFDEKIYVEDIFGETETKDGVATGYNSFCIKKGVRPKAFLTFSKEIKRFANETEKIEQRKEAGSKRYYVGLRLIKDDF